MPINNQADGKGKREGADLWRAMRQTAKVDAKVERVGTVCMATHSPGSQGGSGQAGDTTWVSVAGQPTHTDNNNNNVALLFPALL